MTNVITNYDCEVEYFNDSVMMVCKYCMYPIMLIDNYSISTTISDIPS